VLPVVLGISLLVVFTCCGTDVRKGGSAQARQHARTQALPPPQVLFNSDNMLAPALGMTARDSGPAADTDIYVCGWNTSKGARC